MPNFVEDDLPLGDPKTDLDPLPAGADPTKYIQATDWQEHRQYLDDIKKVLRGEASYLNRLGAVADGATITGAGTAASPLAATPAVADGVTIVGAGTTGSPFIAVAAAPSGDAYLESLRFEVGTAISIAAGVNNNWDPGWSALSNKTALPVTAGLLGSTITGMVEHPLGRGTIVLLQNAMPGYPVTIAHMSTDSLASKRILCPDERDLVIPSGGSAILQCMGIGDGTHGWRTLAVSSSSFKKVDAQKLLAGRLVIGPTDQASPIVKGGALDVTLTGGQNDDLNPTGFAAAGRIRMIPGSGSTLTGMAGVNDGLVPGEIKVIQIFGALTFKHQSSSSAAGRRFYLPGASDLVFAGVGAVTMVYDNNQYWWPIGVSK